MRALQPLPVSLPQARMARAGLVMCLAAALLPSLTVSSPLALFAAGYVFGVLARGLDLRRARR